MYLSNAKRIVRPRDEDEDNRYPTPWRVAESTTDGQVVVVCADGNYVCNASNNVTAQVIVLAVNELSKS